MPPARRIALLVGAVPLVGVALIWFALDVVVPADADEAEPVVALALLGATGVCAAAIARLRWASRWAPLWGLATTAATVVLLVLSAGAAIGTTTTDSGTCGGPRVYC